MRNNLSEQSSCSPQTPPHPPPFAPPALCVCPFNIILHIMANAGPTVTSLYRSLLRLAKEIHIFVSLLFVPFCFYFVLILLRNLEQ